MAIVNLVEKELEEKRNKIKISLKALNFIYNELNHSNFHFNYKTTELQNFIKKTIKKVK